MSDSKKKYEELKAIEEYEELRAVYGKAEPDKAYIDVDGLKDTKSQRPNLSSGIVPSLSDEQFAQLIKNGANMFNRPGDDVSNLPSLSGPSFQAADDNGNKKGGALRFNKGKTRYVLIPPFAKKALAEVYTRGAHKYSKYVPKDDPNAEPTLGMNIPFEDVGDYILVESADKNWRKGQNWTGAADSMLRHFEAWRAGEDLDPELGTYHLANLAWGAMTLLEFYKIFPEGDDRDHSYLQGKKIGLDIDEVLADWVGAWMELHGLKERPENWSFHRGIVQEFDKMREEGTLNDFYLSLKPRISPKDIPFEPHCYITHRPVPTWVTEQWLDAHGFPTRPVFTVTPEKSKVDYALEQGLDIFVDDGWNNFVAMNRAGICTYLMDAPHNQRYTVGHKRIKSLKELD